MLRLSAPCDSAGYRGAHHVFMENLTGTLQARSCFSVAGLLKKHNDTIQTEILSLLWVKPSFKTNGSRHDSIFCTTLPVAPVCSSWTLAGLSKTSVRQKQGDDSSTSLCCLHNASQPCPNGTQWRQQVAVLLVGTGGHRPAVTPGPGKPQQSQHLTVPEEPINKSQARICSRNTFGIDDAGAMQQTAT